MARGDYFGCAVCDGKAFYDANIEWEYQPCTEPLPPGAGRWDQHEIHVVALCVDCSKTHELRVVPKASA